MNENVPENRSVGGSTPPLGTIRQKSSRSYESTGSTAPRVQSPHATSPRKSRHMSVTRRVMIAIATLAAALPAAAQTQGKAVTTETGLKFIDTTVGTGASPKRGQTCVMHYTGWLSEGGAKGRKFDSSVDRGSPFEFPIGMKRVIAGWDEGVATMKVGGKRTLIIPPQLGYGERGAGGVIPPNATLIFDVELLAIK